MRIITEHSPGEAVHTVVYEHRLQDLEFETDFDRDDIDRFWSSIYFTALTSVDRAIMASRTVHTVELYPSDYDLHAQSVNVVLAAHIESTDHTVVAGPVAHVSLAVDGRIDLPDGRSCTYSRKMMPYARDLLAQTALHYSPIDTVDF